MKRIAILCVLILLIPLSGFTQAIENIDFISPYNDGLAAIKKGNQWAFINQEGTLVIDFRDDVVTTTIENDSYPIFNSDRCLIAEKKEGITYFGYIDTSGKTVIEPQFLNATNFNDNVAIVLELKKQILGSNDIFKKQQVAYNYFQVVINTKGEILHYLTQEPIRITLQKDFIKQPPKITSRLLSENTYAVWSKEKKWEIKVLPQ